MDEAPPRPELFVARDRARRFHRYIQDTLRERRLAYRGADVGMASLVNEAERTLGNVLDDARQTVDDVLHQRLRDRERGYMEMPLVVVTEGIVARVDLARRLDAALGRQEVPAKAGRAAMLALLQACLDRIDAFCAAYDEKQPLPPARPVDTAHVLDEVEAAGRWELRLRTGQEVTAPPFDRAPPHVESAADGLADVLHAARAALPLASGPWRVTTDAQGGALRLAIGEAQEGDEILDVPDRLVRALQVLSFRHKLEVRCVGVPAAERGGLLSEPTARAAEIHAITLSLGDDGETVEEELTLASCAGQDAALGPEAERAVQALLQAPGVPPDGQVPPPRMVAWLGLFRVLDETLRDLVVKRASTNPVRVHAGRIPRETTRKAPVKTSVREQLRQSFDGYPVQRLDAVSSDLAAGKVPARYANAGDAAVILSLVGRTWAAAGQHLPRALVLAPLSEDEVNLVIADLVTIARLRQRIEGGETPAPTDLRAMERALIAVLGRFGRVTD